MSNKKIIIFAIIVLAFFTFKQNGLLYMIRDLFVEDDKGGSLAEDIGYIYNDDYTVDLIIYGDEVEFVEEMKYRRITEITESSITSSADYVFLIICDRSGKAPFDVDTLRFLKEYSEKNLRFNFEYVGEAKMHLYTNGEVFDEWSSSGNDMSFGYIVYEGIRIQHGGLWSKDCEKYLNTPESFMESVLYYMKNIIRSNE